MARIHSGILAWGICSLARTIQASRPQSGFGEAKFDSLLAVGKHFPGSVCVRQGDSLSGVDTLDTGKPELVDGHELVVGAMWHGPPSKCAAIWSYAILKGLAAGGNPRSSRGTGLLSLSAMKGGV